MILPNGFQFSQGSLQDYEDCHRRFLLRYVQQLAWPAVESEPMMESERFARQGRQFHKMIQQHLIGVPADNISSMIVSEELREWWHNYCDYYQQEELGKQKALYPEISLSAAIGNHRITATYDLISVQNDSKLVITDWKTNRRRPQRIWLERKLQTRVYPYLVARAGLFLNEDQLIDPEHIRMIYWFASYPNQPEIFIYSNQSFSANQSYLENLIDEIDLADENHFVMTGDETRCHFCVYRSYCARGIQAGNIDSLSAGSDDLDSLGADNPFDIDQIVEIPF